ncbi:MAG: YegP family protein [Kofleriaceae bacterium]
MRNLNSLLVALVLSASATSALVGCATQADDDVSDADSNATTAGKFDLWQANDGWHFHLAAGNGAILLTSEAYASRTSAINGILSVETNGVDHAQYSLEQASNGGYLLHLVAGNHEIISFSQIYTTKSNATRAITACVRAVTTYLDKLEANTTGARVSIEEGSTNQFRFNVVAANGQVVLSSESYTTAAAAWNGAFAVQDASAVDANFAVLTATDGRFYFTLTAQNGQVVGISQMYTAKASAQAGIASVKATLAKLHVI